MTTRVIRAAAGCGKTTALATAYLELVADGVPVDQIVAITFTRRAAAELVERIGLALAAASGDSKAGLALGSAGPRYLQAAPDDPGLARAALADLGSAPIGTTDHFVHRLLAEFALDASLPLPDGRQIPLDLGLVAVADLSVHLDAAARRYLDPPAGEPCDAVRTLTPHYTLREISAMLTRSTEVDDLRAGSAEEVLGWLARRIAARFEGIDLPSVLGVTGRSRHDMAEHLAGLTDRSARWAAPRVADWVLAGSEPHEAPIALVSWVRLMHRSKLRVLWKALEDTAFDFGITEVRMDHVVASLRHPYEEARHLQLADELRDAVEFLRIRVRSDAIEAAAIHGELPHRQLTRAAAQLCRQPVTHGRFTALLVDELQDASRDQLDLYEAIAKQPGVRSVFVGDSRQSIYLFRGGEPEGLERLTARAESSVEALLTNYRSSPALIEAHRALFAALQSPMRRSFWVPPEPLAGLLPAPGAERHTLDSNIHHELSAPVVLVHDRRRVSSRNIDDDALYVFHERLLRARREPGHQSDTAAVLCHSWYAARRAASLLREIAGSERAAWVDGGDGWIRNGVARDLSIWLRALLDPTDEVAWLAVCKHPSVGLTDGALARIHHDIGPMHRLLARLDALAPPHRTDDIEAYQRCRPALLTAMASLGRDDTSLVLDRLVSSMGWRSLIAAGPGGLDEVARLEVLLDWIGELDSRGAHSEQISAMLHSRVDAPRVHLARPSTTITCTTVFQAKGLAWDHVAVLSPGRSGRAEPDPETDTWIRLGEERVRLLGLSFDPVGGMVPYHDPLRRLSMTIRATRLAEEGARVAYVAITRARRSVTMGLPSDHWGTSPIQKLIAQTWTQLRHPSLVHIGRPKRPGTTALPRMEVVPTGRPTPIIDGPSWPMHEVAPSSAARRFSPEHRETLARRIASDPRLEFVPGGPDLPPPRDSHPNIDPTQWGTLVHDWLAAWRFDAEPSAERIEAWMQSELGRVDAPIAAWLSQLCLRLRAHGGPLWELTTQPDTRLEFEYPLIGVAQSSEVVPQPSDPAESLLFAGRIDLLVVRDSGVIVVDFKAGDSSPAARENSLDKASLDLYGPQLECYRAALNRAGLQVERVALWYIRTGAAVLW